ncbi:type I methionyl aminopeptidase [Aestuariimicrobium ganziense]|uniref:type I methionyl aminopeptidase n=1 Tax=Aestuariimicrobium ganziense TaxID=2773677 RepID=UPI0019436023|nr:type I methionyl aminopeptidase [Aestuariimicrobium ganziense]
MRAKGLELKRPDQLLTMRRAGLVVAEVLSTLRDLARPGATTAELDQAARDILAARGAGSSFLGYGADWGMAPYPAVTCISVNEEIVHGIPGTRVLDEGDIVSVDFGAIVDDDRGRGWHGDAARTFLVGQVEDDVAELSRVTEESMWAGIGAMRLGGRIGDISHAIESSVAAHRRPYGIVREYTGHGIGSQMHMSPDVPNHGRAGRGPKVVEGLCLAIEPMVTMKGEGTAVLDDDWTVVTTDGSWASHWENTVTFTKQGLWVLTLEDGGEAELTRRGLPFGPLAD